MIPPSSSGRSHCDADTDEVRPGRPVRGHRLPRDQPREYTPCTPMAVIRNRRRRLSRIGEIAAFLERLGMFAALLLILFGLVFGMVPMPDADMEPGIGAGDLLLFYRMDRDVSGGDVIVYESEDTIYVGRVVAAGGDTVEITDDARLKINGSLVYESDIYYSTPLYEDGIDFPVELAQDQYFVLCDYREGGTDSRILGPVAREDVCGTVISVLRRSGL